MSHLDSLSWVDLNLPKQDEKRLHLFFYLTDSTTR